MKSETGPLQNNVIRCHKRRNIINSTTCTRGQKESQFHFLPLCNKYWKKYCKTIHVKRHPCIRLPRTLFKTFCSVTVPLHSCRMGGKGCRLCYVQLPAPTQDLGPTAFSPIDQTYLGYLDTTRDNCGTMSGRSQGQRPTLVHPISIIPWMNHFELNQKHLDKDQTVSN